MTLTHSPTSFDFDACSLWRKGNERIDRQQGPRPRHCDESKISCLEVKAYKSPSRRLTTRSIRFDSIRLKRFAIRIVLGGRVWFGLASRRLNCLRLLSLVWHLLIACVRRLQATSSSHVWTFPMLGSVRRRRAIFGRVCSCHFIWPGGLCLQSTQLRI